MHCETVAQDEGCADCIYRLIGTCYHDEKVHPFHNLQCLFKSFMGINRSHQIQHNEHSNGLFQLSSKWDKGKHCMSTLSPCINPTDQEPVRPSYNLPLGVVPATYVASSSPQGSRCLNGSKPSFLVYVSLTTEVYDWMRLKYVFLTLADHKFVQTMVAGSATIPASHHSTMSMVSCCPLQHPNWGSESTCGTSMYLPSWL